MNPDRDAPAQVSKGVRQFFFEHALLPEGWCQDVTLTADERGLIVAVQADTSPRDAVRVGGTVIPGIPNVHSHAHQRAMAGLTERAGHHQADSFWTWRTLMYECLDALTPDDLEAIATQLYVEMLKAGYTWVGEFQYVHHDRHGRPFDDRAEMSLRTLQAARYAGIGITVLPVLYRFGGFAEQPPVDQQRRFINDADEFLAIAERLAGAVRGRSGERIGIAPHSLRAISRPLLTDVLAAWRAQERRPVHIHIAEQLKEVSDCQEAYGRRPVDWLFDHFDVDADWCLIHATHMTPEEYLRVANSQAVVGLCPTTEANLGDGVFDARGFLHINGRLSIGSDSHCSVSPVEELRWLEYGQRLRDHQRNVLASPTHPSTGRRILTHIYAGGAGACGAPIGRLAPGARADFVALDDRHPLLFGRSGDSLLDSWLFSGNENVVDTVVVGGNIVVENGHHDNEDSVAERYTATLKRLTANG